jgi:hypothetical protein
MAASPSYNYDRLSAAHQERLREIVDHIHSMGCTQTYAAVEIGKMLMEAKGGLQHGEFGQWCTREAGYRPRKAQNLMNLALFATREPDVLHIPASAGFMLAAPTAPPHIVQLVLSRARDGGRVTVAWVEQLLAVKNEEEPRAERSNTSEFIKIARLLASAVGNSEAKALRKLLEAASAASIQRFVADLQSSLQNSLHDDALASSINRTLPQPAVGL